MSSEHTRTGPQLRNPVLWLPLHLVKCSVPRWRPVGKDGKDEGRTGCHTGWNEHTRCSIQLARHRRMFPLPRCNLIKCLVARLHGEIVSDGVGNGYERSFEIGLSLAGA